MRTLLLSGLLLIACLTTSAQEPIGDPNEVWISCPNGDTLYVGQEVELQVHLANNDIMDLFNLFFKLYSEDEAKWEWLPQSDTSWHFSGDMLSIPEDSRFWDEQLELRVGGWEYPPTGDSTDGFYAYATSFSDPDVPAGPLEHAFSIHFKPTEVGTLCLDSSRYYAADDTWFFTYSGNFINPSWNGPFCFTVVEPPVLGDVNCDGAGNVGDAVYLINWVFKNGDPPCK